MELPSLPLPLLDFTRHVEAVRTREQLIEALRPYTEYEATLRQIFAQQPDHPAASQNHLVPVFDGGNQSRLTIKARDLSVESDVYKEKFLLPLSDADRKATGAAATVKSLRDFKTNFNLFSESSLIDLDWNNVIAAGSSAVTALLPVPPPHNESKRALRTYYHEKLAPASDVDLFLYGLTEQQAIEKIKHIEQSIRNSVLSETTVVRTKNAITIISEYPIRQVQIVLRLYRTPSEILSGFDVDCSAVAYDGKQVWAAPRALAAFVMQMNTIDLTRRSPSYESRLAKYARRGFEVHWPILERKRIDPTVYERAFKGVVGLARLLVLERLPHPSDRDEYLAQRRMERGRPALPWQARYRQQLPGNVKDADPHDVAEWVEEDDVSNYHTFTIPWGPKYTPKKVEKLLYSKDLLLNAEWNRSKDRDTRLHRHPAFFGTVEDVLRDCCGYCPKPESDEDFIAHEKETKTFITGDVSFIKDDPGRQSIGSFHPITDSDWTEMAYIGNTARLCQAIVDRDLEGVLDWCQSEDADINRRDHTGRAPIHLAAMCSTLEIMQVIIERGARIVARIYNGFTALHIAAYRGNIEMVRMLMAKSEENQASNEVREQARKQTRRATYTISDQDALRTQDGREDDDETDDQGSDSFSATDEETESVEGRTTGSYVDIRRSEDLLEDEEDAPDVYDVDVLAWDAPVSPLHLAIVAGHVDVMRLLVEDYTADVMLPVKLGSDDHSRHSSLAILTMLLPVDLPLAKATNAIETLLDLGASPLQADLNQWTAVAHLVADCKVQLVETIAKLHRVGVEKAINHLRVERVYGNSARVRYPLQTAICSDDIAVADMALVVGARPFVDIETFAHAYNAAREGSACDAEKIVEVYYRSVEQPVIIAARHERMLDLVVRLVDAGADANTLPPNAHEFIRNPDRTYGVEDKSLLDIIGGHRERLQDFLDRDSAIVEPKASEELQNDEYYLRDLELGSYKYWSASRALEDAKYIWRERVMKLAQESENSQQKPATGCQAKRRAAADLIQKIDEIRDRLIAKGAKSFYDLHPNLRGTVRYAQHAKRDNRDGRDETPKDTSNVYSTRFVFSVADITPKRQARYEELFEAAFAGNTSIVKGLCLKPGEDGSRPLMIAVSDDSGFSPFSIAVIKGFYDLAQVILDIAAAQYRERDETKRIRYALTPTTQVSPDCSTDSDSDSDEDDDKMPRFYKTLVDDRFTIDDVDAAARSVRSGTDPLHLITWPCEIWKALDMSAEAGKYMCQPLRPLNTDPYISYNEADRRKPWAHFAATMQDNRARNKHSLFKLAAITRDERMMKFLLDMKLGVGNADVEDLLLSLDDQRQEVEIAMRKGDTNMLRLLIKSRGTMMPLHHLAQNSGIVVEDKPKYYQGLSVYGKKRRDWAQRGQDAYSMDRSDRGSPILAAAFYGHIDTLEWFMSDTPGRMYFEFTESFKEDPRIRVLLSKQDGVKTALEKWFSTRANLILHMIVMSWPGDQNNRLRYLLDRLPAASLEVKSSSGYTPLHLAVSLHNWASVKALLAAGADQRTRNKVGDNILHTIYHYLRDHPNTALFHYLVGLLNPAVVQDLLIERSGRDQPGSLTPLSVYLQNHTLLDKRELRLLDAMLDLSHGRELTLMDGAGDYPLHVQVRERNVKVVKLIALRRPDLLTRENATGMTCLDIAETAYLRARTIDRDMHLVLENRSRSILDQAASDFEPKSPVSDDEYEESTITLEDTERNVPEYEPYRTVALVAQKFPYPRQLVSLSAANEIAERLATRHAGSHRLEARQLSGGFNNRYGHSEYTHPRDGRDDARANDEVEMYRNTARHRLARIPWDEHMEDTGVSVEACMQKLLDLAEGKGFVCCEKSHSRNRLDRIGHGKYGNEIDPPADEDGGEYLTSLNTR